MWSSGKSQRVATSTFGAELQACYTATDVATVLRTLFSELLLGHPRGKIDVRVKNDNTKVVDVINSVIAIVQEKRLMATLLSMRECLERGEVDSYDWGSGIANLSNGLTKEDDGNDLRYILEENKGQCSTKKDEEVKRFRTHQKKQYLISTDKNKTGYTKEQRKIHWQSQGSKP